MHKSVERFSLLFLSEKRKTHASCKLQLETETNVRYGTERNIFKKSLYLKKLKSVLFTKSTLVFISTNI